MSGIRKAFPGVQAIKSCSLEVCDGEIHALVGENGAGKSTLIKILTGAYLADAGEINVFGEKRIFGSPIEARRAGIAAIYQEFSLIPELTVHASLFLGREQTRKGFIDSKTEKRMAISLFERMGVDIDPESRVSQLSTAHQQMVEIARALLAESRILVMDEPTAALTPHEVEILFGILRELKDRGIGILFVTHRIDEVFAITDRVTVMRDGNSIGTWKTPELTRNQLIAYMVGRSIEDEYPMTHRNAGETCFEVRELRGKRVRDISFAVSRGEILGFAGLLGAGRTDVARLIYGADRKESGQILINGKVIEINSPRDAIRNGICLLTEDRKLQGLILKATAKENFGLPSLKTWSRWGFIDQAEEESRFLDRVRRLNIRVAGPDQRTEDLSGGNQQKLLVARWLETNFQIIIFDEPTRGIDVGAKYEMYLLINDLAGSGKAIVLISSDLPEILGISDRILVMKEGCITGEVKNPLSATQEEIMTLAT